MTEPPVMLEYATQKRTSALPRALAVLLVWVILSWLVSPVTALLGVEVGAYHLLAIARPWPALHRPELANWIWSVLLVLDAPVLIAGPPVWGLFCELCRQRLRDDTRAGLALGQAMCRGALWVGGFLLLTLLYRLGLAIAREAWIELPWWAGAVTVVAGGEVAVLGTWRMICRAGAAAAGRVE